MQELPASTRRVRVVAALPGRDGRSDSRRAGQPLWWTLRRPCRPLTYHAVHRMFERVKRRGGDRGDAARAAAHRGLPDGRGSGAAVDRCAVRPGTRAAVHHADLPDAAQGGRDPPGTGPPRRAEPARRGHGPRPGAGLPAGSRSTCCSAASPDEPRSPPRPAPSTRARSGRRGARGDRARFRPAQFRRPGRRLVSRGRALVWPRRPVRARYRRDASTKRVARRAAVAGLVAGQPGATWQRRWVASGAEAPVREVATSAGRPGCVAGQRRRVASGGAGRRCCR